MSEKLPPITNVTISTVTVDIQTIRVGNKQMTLSIFRQLPRKSIIDDHGNLIELPWGWVNYDHDGGTPFVYNHHGTLYRSDIPIEEHHHLEIKLETTYSPPRKFILECKHPYYLTINLRFDDEQNARLHLENRLASIAILETARQLFIAI